MSDDVFPPLFGDWVAAHSMGRPTASMLAQTSERSCATFGVLSRSVRDEYGRLLPRTDTRWADFQVESDADRQRYYRALVRRHD